MTYPSVLSNTPDLFYGGFNDLIISYLVAIWTVLILFYVYHMLVMYIAFLGIIAHSHISGPRGTRGPILT